jgi:glutaredoxin
MESSPYAQRWAEHALGSNPHTVLYGSSYCSCCTKLRARLELAGWRYRWVELTHKKADLLRKKKDWSGWRGTLPVIVVNGIWLEVGNSEFVPWPIANPKRRKDIIIGAVDEVLPSDPAGPPTVDAEVVS